VIGGQGHRNGGLGGGGRARRGRVVVVGAVVVVAAVVAAMLVAWLSTGSPSPAGTAATGGHPGAGATPSSGTATAGGPAGGVNVEPSIRPSRYGGPNPQSWWCVMPNCSPDFANAGQGPMPTVQHELSEARDLGAAYVRLEFPWAELEPQRGVFDWSRPDAIFQAAAQSGVTLQPDLMWTPAWAARSLTDPPLRVADWTGFVTAFVQRYSTHLSVVEIWNEPDDGAYFTGSAQTYATDLLDPAYAAIKSVDPSLQVMAAGSSNDAGSCCTWLSGILAAGARFDIASFHNYASTYVPESHEYRKLLDAAGRTSTPIWMTEFGVQTPADQVAAIQTVFATPTRSSDIQLADWYNLRDTASWSCCPPKQVYAASWGLLTGTFIPKASFGAMQKLVRGRPAPVPVSADAFRAPAAPTSPGGLPYTRTVGINIAGDGWGSQVPTLAQIPAQISDAAHNLHVSWIRENFDWWHVDQSQATGSYDWSSVDPIMQAAAQSGVGVLAILGSPLWNGSTPTYPNANFWSAYVSAFVQRYDHQPLVIEPWNEPDQASNWTLGASAFLTQIQLPAYQAVKSVDPSVLVHMATADYAAGGQAFWSAVVSAAAGRPFVDLPGFHDYANLADTWAPQLRSFLSAHGVSYRAIWCSEFGAAITPPVTEPDQAHIDVLNSHIPPTLSGTGGAPDAVFYYAYSDLSEGGAVQQSYGLMNPNGSIHYQSYSVFRQLMAGVSAPSGTGPPPSAPAKQTSTPAPSTPTPTPTPSPTPTPTPSLTPSASPSGSHNGRGPGSTTGSPSGAVISLTTTSGGRGSTPWLPILLGALALVVVATALTAWLVPGVRRRIPGLPPP
jgi:hypothetical protein